MNSILYFILNNSLYTILCNLFKSNLDIRLNIIFISTKSLVFLFIICIKTIIKMSIYTIAINNDIEEIKNDVTIYIGDFVSNMIYIFTAGFTFIFTGLLLSIPVITFIIYLDCCSFFMIYAVAKRKDSGGNRYSSFECISKSFSITKSNRFKLLFFNSIIIFFCITAILYMPSSVFVKSIDIAYLIKIFITDFLIVYMIKIGFALDKIEIAKTEEARQKEIEKQYSATRAAFNASFKK